MYNWTGQEAVTNNTNDTPPAPDFFSYKRELDLAEAKTALEELREQKRELDALLEKAQYKEEIKKDFFRFCKEVMGFKELYEPLHRPLCELISNPGKRRKLILIPRGHFKTTIISICYPLWLLANDQNKRIALCSNNVEKGEENLEEIQVRAEREEFQALFGKEVGHPDSWPKRTQGQVRIRRKGSTTGPSIAVYAVGSSEVGRHFDHILIDDMVGAKEVNTVSGRNKVWSWFTRQYSVLDPGQELVVLGTRWSYDDPYSRIKTLTGWEIVQKKVIEDGKFIFPTRFNSEFLREIKEAQDDFTFSCFYYNEPAGEGANPFDVREFLFTPYHHDRASKRCWTYILVDPAVSEEEYSCPNGIIIGDALPHGIFYVREAILEKMRPDKLVKLLFELAHKHDPRSIIIESEAQQKTYHAWIKAEMFHRDFHFRVEEVKNPKNIQKYPRLLALQPFLHGHQIRFMDNMPGKEDLVREFETYPKGKDDDLICALSFVPAKVKYPPAWDRPELSRVVPKKARKLTELIERHEMIRPPRLGRPRLLVGNRRLTG